MSTLKASGAGIELVKQAVSNKGWSQDELVDKVRGVTGTSVAVSTYQRFCRGENIRSDIFRAICECLGFDVEQVKVKENSVSPSSEESERTELVSSNLENVVDDTGIKLSLDSMPDIPTFYGREEELNELTSQINNQRMVVISGILGVGKTWISVKIVNHFREASDKFKYLIWRSIKNPPHLKNLIYSILEPFVPEKELNEVRISNDGGIFQILQFITKEPCLIILDNWNDLFKEGELAGYYKEGLKNYGELLKNISRINHRSCIVITTSEELAEIQHNSPTYFMKLEGLDLNNSQKLLNGISSNLEIINEVIHLYKSNWSLD
jgi:hypothetical protein